MDLRLDGKTALVTGGSRGIGKAIAKAFVESGAEVMITSRKAESCEETANEIGCLWEAGHVGNPEDAERIVGATVERLGGVDILVNNAGVSYRAVQEHIEEKDKIEQFAVNYFGPIKLIRRALPHIRAQRWGRIIKVS